MPKSRQLWHIGAACGGVGGLLYLAQNCGQRHASAPASLTSAIAPRQNNCQGSPSALAVANADAALAHAIQLDDPGLPDSLHATAGSAAAAVPRPLLQTSMAFGGRVRISAAADGICRAASQAAGGAVTGRLDGCFLYLPGDTEAPQRLDIAINASDASGRPKRPGDHG
jgi:hypothetical protein